MNKKILLGIAGGSIIVVITFFLIFFSKSNKSATINPNEVSSETPSNTQNEDQKQLVQTDITTVTLTRAGFEPSLISVKAGARVIWVNNSGSSVTVNSNDHPTHRLFSRLNLGEFSNGSSVQIVFQKKAAPHEQDQKQQKIIFQELADPDHERGNRRHDAEDFVGGRSRAVA